MASFPLNQRLAARRSSKLIQHNEDIAQAVGATLAAFLFEDSNRRGYPRGGAFDRLAILKLIRSDEEEHTCSGSLCVLAPSTIEVAQVHIARNLNDLFYLSDAEILNIALLVFVRNGPGTSKYGDKNVILAQAEQGIFLGILHYELCVQGVENRIHAGINTELLASTIALPIDFLTPLALLA